MLSFRKRRKVFTNFDQNTFDNVNSIDFWASKAPLLMLDMPKTHYLPLQLQNYKDVWDFLQNVNNLNCLPHAHWFCEGVMHNKQRVSYRYLNFYDSPRRYMYGPFVGISGYEQCRDCDFCWYKHYNFFGLQRTSLIINTKAVFKRLEQCLMNFTYLNKVETLLIVDYLLPKCLFIATKPRQSTHCKHFFL